jgi:GntR family transcriptional repressor for pyruvate dehydrogenase complex
VGGEPGADPDRGRIGREWKPVRVLRASEDVVAQISATFFDGLRPGDWLGTEAELADRFGVSRVTIRDAARTLEARGIVDVKVGARGGIRVANPDPSRLAQALAVQLHLMGITRDELIEAQQAIEPATAALAAQRATAESIDAMHELVERCRAAMTTPEHFVEPALDFHLAIADAAGNRALRAALTALRPLQGAEFRAAPPRTSHRLAQRIVTMHTAILEAIRLHDPELAAERMREHLTHMAMGRRLPISARESHLLL